MAEQPAAIRMNLHRFAHPKAMHSRPRPGKSLARADALPHDGGETDIDAAAVAVYCSSVNAGSPISERKLAQMFGMTSRRWARSRIADARSPAIAESTPVAEQADHADSTAVLPSGAAEGADQAGERPACHQAI